MGKYKIYHTFKERVVVPIAGITPNVEWILEDKEKERMVLTSDGVVTRVKSWESMNILSEEGKSLIKEIYKMDVASFLERWYNSLYIDSLEVLYIELEKV